MLTVGITGGIGSGKSVVCQVFGTLGIPVFSADAAARYLMENDAALICSISGLLGPDVYKSGKLDRAQVAAIIYGQPEKLQRLNAIVHPATTAYSRKWIIEQRAPYVIKEAAIFFESGTYIDMNVMIGVYAPKELRITRAMKRSAMDRDQVLAIIARQMDEDEKMQRCDFVITNDDTTAVLPQVLNMHEQLLNRKR